MKKGIRIICAILSILMLCQVIVSCKTADGSQITTTNDDRPKNPTGSDYDGETVTLLDAGVTPVIYVDAHDMKQSVRAVGDLASDFERVSGKKTTVVNTVSELEGSPVAVIIGTLGSSEFIDTLAGNGTIDVSAIEGKWEAYTINVVKDLEPGIATALVIAGSDRRGTIYGTYELSEQIGVSPWYYWGDVEIEHKDTVVLPVEQIEKTDMPDVKYRGIFINDEENFTAWSSRTTNSKNNPGRPNPDTYATIFELLLRLRANTLWPAMHSCSDAFNKFKNPKTGISYNAELADEYGIVMSASHCEMMLRDNEGEWDEWAAANQKKYNITKVNNDWHASYDYTVNADAMNAYWEERVAENYRFENIYMIGLRGVHDSGINCSKLSDTSYKGKATVVKKAVEAQLKILEKYEKKYEEETGQAIKFQTAYCVYKEAAEYYKYDLSLPTDCCLVYCDDNHGYVRQVPSEKELETYDSFGMYYHVSYWGRPCSYLWVSNTPLPMIAEEMRKSYYSGMQGLWILNVGDIKPAELKTEYFMDLAWDIDAHTENNTEEFSTEFLTQNFGMDKDKATSFASTLTDLWQMMRNYVPEQMGKREGMDYSVSAWGDEGQTVVNRMQKIYEESLSIMDSLPQGKKDSYYEMIHFTVKAYLLMCEKYVYEAMNALCIDQGRYAAANLYADLCENAYQAVLTEVAAYNAVHDNKWSGIMDPYNTAQPTIDGAPTVTRASATDASGGVGIAGETQTSSAETVTLLFGSLADDTRFIDIFNKGVETDTWALSAPVWVIIRDADGKTLEGGASGENTVYGGSVGVESRYYVSIDWSKFGAGETKNAEIILTDSRNNKSSVGIKAVRSASDTAADIAAGRKGYYEENGLVSIEAEHYSSIVNQGGFSWRFIDGLGRSGGTMIAGADEGFSEKKIASGYAENSPYLEYDIYFTNPGSYTGYIYRLPTLHESATGRSTCNIGYSLDGSSVKTVKGTTKADDSDTSAWAQMILLHVEKLKVTLDVESAGWHTLRVYMVDPNMAFDQIVISSYTLPYSRLAPPETFNTVSWTKADISYLPELSLDDVNWSVFVKKFDFTKNGSSSQTGYIKVTENSAGSESDGWVWTPSEGAAGYYRSGLSKFAALDMGFVGGSGDSTFRIIANPGEVYGITVNVGDPNGTVKAVGMSIACNGTVVYDGIGTGAAVTPYFVRAAADEDGVITLVFGGQWIVNSIEIYSLADKRSAGGGAFIPNQDGDIVIEAESALENSEIAYITPSTDNSGHVWSEVAGISGSALFFGPNIGVGFNSTSVTDSQTSKIYYKLNVKSAGRYDVWALIKSAGADDDSVIMALDGKQAFAFNDVQDTAGYIWKQIGSFSSVTEGEHVLNVLGREDGFAIDKIILRPASSGGAGFDGAETRE